jgi:hypothetical protein
VHQQQLQRLATGTRLEQVDVVVAQQGAERQQLLLAVDHQQAFDARARAWGRAHRGSS